MNKTIIIAGILILVLIGGGNFIAMENTQSNDVMMESESAMENTDDAMTKEEGEAMEEDTMTRDAVGDARYVEYSETAFDSASDGRRVLYFYANWCPTCRPADEDFRENMSKIPEDVTVLRVNYNDDQTDQEDDRLAAAYGVTYQHTFVQIDQEGNAVTTWNGGDTDELLSNIKK